MAAGGSVRAGISGEAWVGESGHEGLTPPQRWLPIPHGIAQVPGFPVTPWRP